MVVENRFFRSKRTRRTLKKKKGRAYMNMGNSIIDFNEKKGFICDMDGVIYHGNQILPGVPEFIQWLHDEKKEYLFLTNNSGYTPRELN